MAALILELMGAPAQTIADEYTLTRIGVEPFRVMMLPAALKSIGKDATMNIDAPGVKQFFGMYPEAMLEFVKHLKEVYGGAEGYMKEWLHFTEEEIEQIKSNLRPIA